MRNKCEENDDFVVGLYQKNGKSVHALIKADNYYTYIGPLKSACGHVSDVQYDSPWAKPMEVTDITCKKCLAALEKKGIIPKPEENSPVKLLGTCTYAMNDPVHALIERGPAISNPVADGPLLKALCGSLVFSNVYKPTKDSNDVEDIMARVTCEDCLKMIEQRGVVMPKKDKTAKKKFFLVFYDGGTVDSIYDFEELLQDAHRFKPTINKILLIESYRELSVKEVIVVTDKNGKEITEKDL